MIEYYFQFCDAIWGFIRLILLGKLLLLPKTEILSFIRIALLRLSYKRFSILLLFLVYISIKRIICFYQNYIKAVTYALFDYVSWSTFRTCCFHLSFLGFPLSEATSLYSIFCFALMPSCPETIVGYCAVIWNDWKLLCYAWCGWVLLL